ncbi:type IV pilus assembly protein PilY1 [Alteromonadaceae bacterium 2753L.S.0a.02]|nr:type IV pilus assembly protein PilY1 [Alteromonadaceae bacterium 2753L.S.0a.02]
MFIRNKFAVNRFGHNIFPSVCCAILLGFVSHADAGPGKLSDIPLYVGSGVKPNVLYVVDDSGSMQWEILKSSGAEMAYPYVAPANGDNIDDSTYYRYEWVAQIDIFNPETKRDVLELCPGYNVLAFNPNIDYSHWAGVDNTGAAFENMTLDNARFDPRKSFDSSLVEIIDYEIDANNGQVQGGRTWGSFDDNRVDLTNAVYMPWDDTGETGVFEAGECNEIIDDDPDSPLPQSVKDQLRGFTAETLPSGLSDEEVAKLKQNYANWYTYYRSRNKTMIAALSNALDKTEQRVGLTTINGNSDVGFLVQDVGSATDSENEVRQLLLEKAVSIKPQWASTPLETALMNAGRYFFQSAGVYPTDNFFGVSSPASPILADTDGGACQQNYTVMMTDGFSNAPSNYFSLSQIASYFYSTDLSPLADIVDSNNPLDTASHQHMVTHAVAFGVDGNFSPDEVVTASEQYAVDQDDPASQQTFLEDDNFWGPAGIFGFDGIAAHWPLSITPKSEDTIDDLFHATVLGRGRFFNSSNPQELIQALNEVEDAIADDTSGTAASVGFNSTNIDSDTLLFQGWFDTATWHGELLAFEYIDTEDGSSPISPNPVWKAGEKLAERVDPDSDNYGPERAIITYDGSAGIPFRSPEGSRYDTDSVELTENQLRDLLALAPYDYDTLSNDEHVKNKAYLDAMIAFLRGDTSYDGEGGEEVFGVNFRTRFEGNVLGDIVHSSPVYVAGPSEPYPDFIEGSQNSYLEFAAAHQDRTPVIYVGANDGMLHAFQATNGSSADDGKELLGYIPSLLFSSDTQRGLHHLASQYYLNNHRAYVDGPITPADVFVGGTWRTYLVGALNAGGKGIYVLDITNPSSFTEENADDIVVTEFTNDNLGYTFARPQIAKLNNGDWAAIFGNGYNNTGSYQASLFILYLDGHEGVSGPAYREITTGVGSATDPSDCNSMESECNGLSSPSIMDITGDSIIDRAYAGDIQGNLWAFDLSSENPDEWGIAHDYLGTPKPLFRACRSDLTVNQLCPAEDRQPITVRPVIVSHPSKRGLATDPNLLVFFGTGQYVADGDTEADNFSAATQNIYTVWDAGPDNGNLQASDLATQTISTNTSATGPDTRTLSANTVAYTLSQVGVQGVYGWKADLIALKERVVVNPLSVGPFVVFATTIPSNEACLGGGSGFLMVARLVDGTQPRFQVFPNRQGNITGFVLDAAPGGPQIIDNDIVIPNYQGEIQTEDFLAAQPRPSRRAAWSILK